LLNLAIQKYSNSNDSDGLKQANQDFSESTQFFADKRMNKAIMQAIAGKDVNKI
jgi:hypothetical protein